MDVNVRKLKKEDLQKGFLETLSNLFKIGLTTQKAEAIFDQIDDNPFYHIFVAELDGEIVGATTLLVEQKFLLGGTKFGYIEDVATRKGFERRGIGSLLQKAAIEVADREGCCLIRLDCKDHNVPFYKKNGFYVKDSNNRMQIDLHTPSMDE